MEFGGQWPMPCRAPLRMKMTIPGVGPGRRTGPFRRRLAAGAYFIFGAGYAIPSFRTKASHGAAWISWGLRSLSPNSIYLQHK